ncbi:hypothetical protein AMS59_10200 [Lysinibacillus sp. FJAT-14745]|nr:hypothetical protein AMS59_10200 [Lysinibacillus sp. FJAT-14745]
MDVRDNLSKKRLLSNTFVDKVRNQMEIDEEEYRELIEILTNLSDELKSQKVIDKELAMTLYSMPQIIRNVFQTYEEHNGKATEFGNKLEDIWIDLDAMVLECFIDTSS